MATFRGTFDYSLDAKNRLTVPARFRAALAEGVVMAKGTEPCVALWVPEQYDAFTRGRSGNNLLGTQTGPLPTADELGAELERFLASQPRPGDNPGA